MKEKLNKLFFENEMTYEKVIYFALGSGIVTGLIMLCPFLSNTSIENVGVCFEMWIFLAMIIILNCKKPLEAGLKTFIFFLISQPMVYLVQVPFSDLSWGIFSFYKRWFLITLLTLPGGAIAYFSKSNNILGVLVLSVANFILMFFEFPKHFLTFIANPPYQALACLFIILLVELFILLLIKDNKLKILTFVLAIVFAVAGFIYENNERSNIFIALDGKINGKAPYEIIEVTEGIDVAIEDSTETITVVAYGYGQYPISIKDADGNIIELVASIEKDNMEILVVE